MPGFFLLSFLLWNRERIPSKNSYRYKPLHMNLICQAYLCHKSFFIYPLNPGALVINDFNICPIINLLPYTVQILKYRPWISANYPTNMSMGSTQKKSERKLVIKKKYLFESIPSCVWNWENPNLTLRSKWLKLPQSGENILRTYFLKTKAIQRILRFWNIITTSNLMKPWITKYITERPQ